MKTHIIQQPLIAGVLDGSITQLRMPVDLINDKDRRGTFGIPINGKYYMFQAPFQVGDVVQGLEEWTDDLFADKDTVWYKQDFPDSPNSYIWKPAETCPRSRIKFEVMGVDVQKLGAVGYKEWDIEGLYLGQHDGGMHQEDEWLAIETHWNTLHPETPFDPELPTWVIGIKLL